ncbi:MAG: MFS transporter [Acidobacteriota bacterium]|nr:MFS transporter [Acidobacteriota bacterium]
MGNERPAQTPTPAKRKAHLPRNVWILAWVAFFNDTSTEMSYWLLPQFLVTVLGAPPMAFGLIEGAAETIASFSRLLSGWLSDLSGRRKPLTAAGYALANLVKPLLAIAHSWQHVFWIRFADRAAKGFRGAPRDALIADSVDPADRGSSFGLRQAMDTAGAIVGPLSAILFLRLFAGKVRDVFWMAAIPGVVCIALVWFGVKEVRKPASAPARSTSSKGRSSLFPRGRLLLIFAALALFSLGNSSDLFLVLRAQNLGMEAWTAPALGLLFNIVYASLSWPAGRLSDRVPRRWLIVAGYLIYAVVYAGFALSRSPQLVWFLFAVYGSYYALTEGVMKAWIADLAPADSRASVFGVFTWVVGVAAFPASLLAGWIWQHYSPVAPFALSSVLALAAGVLLLFA